MGYTYSCILSYGAITSPVRTLYQQLEHEPVPSPKSPFLLLPAAAPTIHHCMRVSPPLKFYNYESSV